MATGNANALPNEVQEEDTGELTFPKEFDNAETLLISEVFMLLDHRKTQNDEAEEEQVWTIEISNQILTARRSFGIREFGPVVKDGHLKLQRVFKRRGTI